MATKARPTRPTISALLPDDMQVGKAKQTVGDFIVDQIGAGVDPITAAGSVGLLPSEYVAWIREGQQVFQRLNAGADWTKDFTPHQQDLALFAERAVRAQASAVAGLTILSEQLARGGLTKRTVRRKTLQATGQNPQTVETVTTEETLLPDPEMIRWRLEHLEPTVYGKRSTVSIAVQDLTDTDTVADVVAERMRAIIERFRPEAIETTATEVAP